MKSQILASIFLAASAQALQAIDNDRIDLAPFKGHNYSVFSGCHATSEAEAREFCKCQGGYLVDIFGNDENAHLVSEMACKAPNVPYGYVNSWNGDSYECSCIALYQGGPIVVPPVLCDGPAAFICEFDCIEETKKSAEKPKKKKNGKKNLKKGSKKDNKKY